MSPFALRGRLKVSLCPALRELINILALPSTIAKLLSADDMVTTMLSADAVGCGFFTSKVKTNSFPAFILPLPVLYLDTVSLGILLSTSPESSLPFVSM